MAQSAINDGVTHIVATPHSSTEYRFDYDRVRQLHGQLQRLDRRPIGAGDRMRLSSQYRKSGSAAAGCAAVLHQPAELFAGGIQRLCDPAEHGAYTPRYATDGTASDHHASGAQSDYRGDAGAAGVVDSARMLWAGDGGVDHGDVWAEGQSGGVAVDRAGADSYCRERRAQHARAAVTVQPAYDVVREKFGDDQGASVVFGQSVRGIRGAGTAVCARKWRRTRSRKPKKRFLFF